MIVDEETYCNNDAEETELLEGNCLAQVLNQYESQAFNDGPIAQAVQHRAEVNTTTVINAEPVQGQRLLANAGPNQNVQNSYCQDPMFMKNYGQEMEQS